MQQSLGSLSYPRARREKEKKNRGKENIIQYISSPLFILHIVAETIFIASFQVHLNSKIFFIPSFH
jgi:hypothetical protein